MMLAWIGIFALGGIPWALLWLVNRSSTGRTSGRADCSEPPTFRPGRGS